MTHRQHVATVATLVGLAILMAAAYTGEWFMAAFDAGLLLLVVVREILLAPRP